MYPAIQRQFKGITEVALEQLLHLLRQFFAVNFDVDFIVTDGTQAVQVGRADGRPLSIDSGLCVKEEAL